MDKINQITVDCYVIFTRSTYKHWAMRFFYTPISHCYVMIKSDGGHFWHIINPAVTHLSTELALVDDYPHPRQYAGPNAVILPVRSYIRQNPRWGFCFFSCTEVVKAILGIKSFWIFTPFQLYKYLTKGNENGNGDDQERDE